MWHPALRSSVFSEIHIGLVVDAAFGLHPFLGVCQRLATSVSYAAREVSNALRMRPSDIKPSIRSGVLALLVVTFFPRPREIHPIFCSLAKPRPPMRRLPVAVARRASRMNVDSVSMSSFTLMIGRTCVAHE